MQRMTITFDGQRFFEQGEHRLQPGSPRRESGEITVAGADGVLGVDLGGRGRELVQTGTLMAADINALARRVARIESYIDGLAYRLIDASGRIYDGVCLVRLETRPAEWCGRVVRCGYRIDYRQRVEE